MDLNARLRRVTDLFAEGTEVHLGNDPDGSPIVIWVNKLNSFEVEEARRDGIVRRGVRMAELVDPRNEEHRAVATEIALWNDDDLRKQWVAQREEEIYLDVLNDIEAQEGWADRLEQIRRLPTLLEESKVPKDDPRWQQLADLQTEYLTAIRDGQQKKQKEMLVDSESNSREALESSFLETWRQRTTLEEFMEERRITELFIAMRSCDATQAGTHDGKVIWDHSTCDHSARLLPDRAAVRALPSQIIEKVVDALDETTASPREAGNSDAPASSSASSEQSSAPEDPSIASSPIAMPVGAPTT